MDTTDHAQGFRSVAGTRLRLAVAKKPQLWDEKRAYDVPTGYHWATTAEVLAEAASCTELHPAYRNQAGWLEREWPRWSGHHRSWFVCADSLHSRKVQLANDIMKNLPMSEDVSYARSAHFAGLICIRNVDLKR